jgi:cysteine desulfurase
MHEMADARPGLVAIMAANNETGVLQPWREALAISRQWGVPFLCDAVQWIGKMPAHGLGECDFVSGCAHKFGGPKGVGFLKCPAKGRVHPLLVGGKQEEGRRAGTENSDRFGCWRPSMWGPRWRNESRTTNVGAMCVEKRMLKCLPGSEIVGA